MLTTLQMASEPKPTVMNPTALSRRYAAALSRHLEGDAGEGMETASELGGDGAAAGISIIDIARIHEEALALVTRADSWLAGDAVRRAQEFFIAVLKPMATSAVQPPAQTASATQITNRLKVSNADLQASERKARKHTRLRRSSEEVLRQKRVRLVQALKESHALEGDLRRLARRTLAALERERAEFSQLLQDEVAQSLIGIRLRLARIEEKRTSEAEKLLGDITDAGGLVEASSQKMRDAIHRLGGKK